MGGIFIGVALGNQQRSTLLMKLNPQVPGCGFQFQFHLSDISDHHPRGTVCRPMGKTIGVEHMGKEEVHFESGFHFPLCLQRASPLHLSPSLLPTLPSSFWHLLLPQTAGS